MARRKVTTWRVTLSTQLVQGVSRRAALDRFVDQFYDLLQSESDYRRHKLAAIRSLVEKIEPEKVRFL